MLASADPQFTSETTRNIDSLRCYLRDLGSALVCYSGGIDSALVLTVAHQELGAKAVGITAVSHSLAERERREAEAFARSIGAAHHFVSSREIERPGYVKNGPDRCFHCKSELYEIAQAQLAHHGLEHIVNGTNHDDLGDYRPGLEAARNASVKSPLAELAFTKADVRAAAKQLRLHIWEKPASACLSSRIPYGTSVTKERLARIGQFEESLKQLGFRQVRVRFHDTVARLELGSDEMTRAVDPTVRDRITSAGRAAGFRYVTLDLQGYRVGSHNEVLRGRRLAIHQG